MSDPAPAIAPYVDTYATYIPYITPTEFVNANTGVDVSQLVPGGDAPTQAAALLDLLARASSEADRICQKPLAATTDIVDGEFRVARGGRLLIPVPYKPVVAVTAVLTGISNKNMRAMADLSGISIGPKVVKIPVGSGSYRSMSYSSCPSLYAEDGKLFARMTYVNGWMHSELAADAGQGDSTISPISVVGAVPGLPFTIKDGAATENAQVDMSYVYGSPTVPLAAPLRNAHSAGATISALPPYVKNAVIDLGKALAKASGSKGIVMGSINGQKISASAPKTQNTGPGGDEDMARAEKTLKTLRRSV